MTWITATVARERPDLRDEYLKYARHGLNFLEKTMTDAEHGGMFWELSPDQRPKAGGTKHAYGIAFGIYASAAAYEAIGDERALQLALSTFHWLDDHAHDAAHGGYAECLTREGTPMDARGLRAAGPDKFPDGGFPVGYKSMNAHIHL